MTDHPRRLDALLEAWRREVVPVPFPELAAWIPQPTPLHPACWQVMRQVWKGTAWRRHVDPARVLRAVGSG